MKIRVIIIFSLSILLSNSITSKIDNILSKGIEIDSKEISAKTKIMLKGIARFI